MTIYCVAFIGKSNEPLYFYCNEDTSEYLHLQMMTHSSLDVIEQRKKKYVFVLPKFINLHSFISVTT